MNNDCIYTTTSKEGDSKQRCGEMNGGQNARTIGKILLRILRCENVDCGALFPVQKYQLISPLTSRFPRHHGLD